MDSNFLSHRSDGKVYFSTVKAEEMMQKLDSLDKEGKLTVNTIKK